MLNNRAITFYVWDKRVFIIYIVISIN